jgi:hypothetical protein
VKSCRRWQRVSVRLSGKSKQLLWTMSRDHSRELQGTNEHAAMLASRQHIKLLFGYSQNIAYCACKGGVICAEAREPVSNGQTCIWARMQMVRSPFSRWSAPSNTAMPPEFLVKSAHIW